MPSIHCFLEGKHGGSIHWDLMSQTTILKIRGSQYRDSYHVRGTEVSSEIVPCINGFLHQSFTHPHLPLDTVASIGEVEQSAVFINGAWTV